MRGHGLKGGMITFATRGAFLVLLLLKGVSLTLVPE